MLLKINHLLKQTFRGGSGANLRLVLSDRDSYIVKSIERSEERAFKLAAQYEWLKSRQHLNHIVKVFRLHHEGASARYTMEYLEDYISLYEFFETCTAQEVKISLERILNFIETSIHTNKIEVTSENLMAKYIQEKLENNIDGAAKRSQELKKILSWNELIINGRSYQNFSACLHEITQHSGILAANSKHNICDIHGDLTLENIFINPDNGHFVLIDPNCHNLVSSPLMDYSKLLQSTSSKYECMKNLKLTFAGNQIFFDESKLEKDHITNITDDLLRDRLSEQDFKNLKLYEAINFSRILPYRLDLNPENYLIYFCRTIILLNLFLKDFE